MPRTEQKPETPRQIEWNRVYIQHNTSAEIGSHIRREAAKTETGWPFRLARMNAHKAGLDKVATTCEIMTIFAEARANEDFDLGPDRKDILGLKNGRIPDEQNHVYLALVRINSVLKGVDRIELIKEEKWTPKKSEINDIFALVGISEDARRYASPVDSSDDYQKFVYETNMGVTLTELRGSNRYGDGNMLYAEKTKVPQESTA